MKMLWLLVELLNPASFFDRIIHISGEAGQEGPGSWAKTNDGPGFPPPPPSFP